jgi:hypothetical protein
MSALHTAFSSTVIVGLHTLVLTERTIDNDERVFDLQIDGLPRGEIRLLKYYQPGIAVSATQAAIWGGNKLYFASLGEPGFRHYDQDDTLLAVYPLGHQWCLVREISVTIFDPTTGRETARYDHDEIILRYSWSGQRLILEDLQGRSIILSLSTSGERLTPEPE